MLEVANGSPVAQSSGTLSIKRKRSLSDVASGLDSSIAPNTSFSEVDKSERNDFSRARGLLIFFCLVDQLQDKFKSDLQDPHSPENEVFMWTLSLREKLSASSNESEAHRHALTTQILECFDQEITQFEQIDEFFDFLNLLETAMAESGSSDAFLRDMMQINRSG